VTTLTTNPNEFDIFQPQLERPLEAKIREFQRQGRLQHMIFGAQLTPELLEKIRVLADIIRSMARERKSSDRLRQLLPHKRAMLYFTQPSTRTFLSFTAACQILGITCNEVRDPKSSSEVKRESRMDSVRMFSSYFDVIIMRSVVAKFAECCAYKMDALERQEMRSVPVINAGSGSDEHPTQALLDMYTILRTFDFDRSDANRDSRLTELRQRYPDLQPSPHGKTYLFCGDINRGRTVRSLASVLAQYSDVKLYFASPNHEVLRLDEDLRTRLTQNGAEIREFDSLDADCDGQPLLSQVDCVYLTRIQREHNQSEHQNELESLDISPFRLTPERVAMMKQYAPIMHPFPRDSVVNELPVEIDQDPRAMYFRQARNGMWARAALLVHLFDAVESLYIARDESR
jgi:aspartate carbamoyltransferase